MRRPLQIERKITDDSATLALPSYQERCMAYPIGDESAPKQAVREENATVLNQFVFGGCAKDIPGQAERDENDGPANWLYNDAGIKTKSNICSAQMVAVAGIETRPVIIDGHRLGSFYEDENASYCRLGGILPEDIKASRSEQALSVFMLMQKALKTCGMQFTDTVRTWLYLDKLLDWYDEFNAVRTGFFEKTGVFDKVVPASTGIGIANAEGCAISAGLIAVRPKNSEIKIHAVESPLQCPAHEYRSSFSRAVEVVFPTHRTLYVSGTASIDPDGKTIYEGDPARQIDRTMKVVDALLKSRGMGWEDAFRGIVYYTDLSYHGMFLDYCREYGVPKFPLAVSHSDVCRRELLFEIEVDAIRVG